MGQVIGKVFNVQRVPKTAKSVTVGDFDTLEQAKAAMLEHYKTNPKRGNFFYRISEDELEDVGGTVMRKFTISLAGDDGPYYKRFSMGELKEMVAS